MSLIVANCLLTFTWIITEMNVILGSRGSIFKEGTQYLIRDISTVKFSNYNQIILWLKIYFCY